MRAHLVACLIVAAAQALTLHRARGLPTGVHGSSRGVRGSSRGGVHGSSHGVRGTSRGRVPAIRCRALSARGGGVPGGRFAVKEMRAAVVTYPLAALAAAFALGISLGLAGAGPLMDVFDRYHTVDDIPGHRFADRDAISAVVSPPRRLGSRHRRDDADGLRPRTKTPFRRSSVRRRHRVADPPPRRCGRSAVKVVDTGRESSGWRHDARKTRAGPGLCARALAAEVESGGRQAQALGGDAPAADLRGRRSGDGAGAASKAATPLVRRVALAELGRFESRSPRRQNLATKACPSATRRRTS